MHSTLIVARMKPTSADDVAGLFSAFDDTDMPHRMGTRRRELFAYNGLYFHLQAFEDDQGPSAIEDAKTDPAFVKISEDLKPFIAAYDPTTWRSPSDAMAQRFYHWDAR